MRPYLLMLCSILFLFSCKKNKDPEKTNATEIQKSFTVLSIEDILIPFDTLYYRDITIVTNQHVEDSIKCNVTNLPANVDYGYTILSHNGDTIKARLYIETKYAKVGEYKMKMKFTNNTGEEQEQEVKLYIRWPERCSRHMAGYFGEQGSTNIYTATIFTADKNAELLTFDHGGIEITMHMNCGSKTFTISGGRYSSESSTSYSGSGYFETYDHIVIDMTERYTVPHPNKPEPYIDRSTKIPINVYRVEP